ncbi:MAG: DUF6929 family protein [Gemmatirosa sp.]
MKVRAHRDPALVARLGPPIALRYADGADESLDRPAHVRAGSGLARVGDRLVVVQDGAAFLALVDPRTGLADAVTLPADDDGRRQFSTARGNKDRKYDLEACLALPADAGVVRLLAFGSGSTARRERVLVTTFPDGAPDPARADVAFVDAAPLYAALRDAPGFAGSELNVEGAALVGRRVRLFGRGNGATRDGVEAVSATGEVELDALLAFLLRDGPVPALRAVMPYALGEIDGAVLAFTDAATLADGTILYAAAAERSPNSYDDGEVTGSALGLIGADGGARWAPVLDAGGAPFRGKIEGVLPGAGEPGRFWVVTDADDAEAPSTLHEATLRDGEGRPAV